jgi:hypothetical protein
VCDLARFNGGGAAFKGWASTIARHRAPGPSAAPSSAPGDDHGLLTLARIVVELPVSIAVVRVRPPMFGATDTQFDAHPVRDSRSRRAPVKQA